MQINYILPAIAEIQCETSSVLLLLPVISEHKIFIKTPGAHLSFSDYFAHNILFSQAANSIS